ncbi:hypothetical protein [Desulfobacterium sp. N47]|uniref:Replication protein A C-terminal domain-containing protein n=1 Tax=uncultured Desulfobacterium sp. TaxID=201089 RepID=E1YA17_9BACT|nr:unknown protein [uncultured Desulfobacterium sp.]
MKNAKKVKPVKKTVAPKAKKAVAPKKKVAVASKAVKKTAVKNPAVKKAAVKPVKAAAKVAVAKKQPAAPVTILGSVLTTIKRSKNGISIAKIKEKTGLEQRQLSNALYKLLKNGKVALKERGVYIGGITG